MRIKYRNLNSDETYCCNKKNIASLFDKIDININFGYKGFRDQKYNSMYINKKYAQQGAILLLTMVVCKNYELLGIIMKPFINIYIIKKDDFNQQLENEFKDVILPKLFKLYLSHCDDISQEGNSFEIRVWLKEGQINFE